MTEGYWDIHCKIEYAGKYKAILRYTEVYCDILDWLIQQNA